MAVLDLKKNNNSSHEFSKGALLNRSFHAAGTSNPIAVFVRIKMMPSATSNPRRKSVFREVGLVDDDRENYAPVPIRVPILSAPSLPARNGNKKTATRSSSSPIEYWPAPSLLEDVREEEMGDDEESDYEIGGLTQKKKQQTSRKEREDSFEHGRIVTSKADVDVALTTAGGMTRLHRLCVLALLVFLVIPVTHRLPVFGPTVAGPMYGANAALIPRKSMLYGRADSPTDVCTRWSHASMTSRIRPQNLVRD